MTRKERRVARRLVAGRKRETVEVDDGHLRSGSDRRRRAKMWPGMVDPSKAKILDVDKMLGADAGKSVRSIGFHGKYQVSLANGAEVWIIPSKSGTAWNLKAENVPGSNERPIWMDLSEAELREKLSEVVEWAANQ